MEQPVTSIMQRIVSPMSMDDSVAEVEAMMRAKHVSSAPVYDSDGSILGIITSTDLVKFHSTGKDPTQVQAWEICTYRPIEVTPETPLSEVARLMLTHKVHHVLVMKNEDLQGIVSSLDFVRLYLQQQPH
ncbi:MAG TPA: CBS domain-containing protein [Noviherbaspirillum sp.]|nr:CBS domain-containing protein [Noviherbaspirillum sp.]